MSVLVLGDREEGEGHPRWKEQAKQTQTQGYMWLTLGRRAVLWQEGKGIEWGQGMCKTPERAPAAWEGLQGCTFIQKTA